jgi:hypothetical protein
MPSQQAANIGIFHQRADLLPDPVSGLVGHTKLPL